MTEHLSRARRIENAAGIVFLAGLVLVSPWLIALVASL